jgi:hypothetical protein
MNVQNIQKLIDTIKQSEKRFNMTQFFGKLDPRQIDSVNNGEMEIWEAITNPVQFTDVDRHFACNSTACIAGFANFLIDDGIMFESIQKLTVSQRIALFERRAADFMGLSVRQASRIFYNNANSIWGDLYEDNHPDFRNLETGGESDCIYCAVDRTDEHDCEWRDLISMQSITPENAIDVLTMLINGKITL